MEKAENPWPVPVALDDIPDTGLHMEIDASPETRAALAALAGVRELPQLSATFDLIRWARASMSAAGCSARVGQTCVVTLEPVENEIDEPVDVMFTAGRRGGRSGHPRSSHIG